MARRRIQPSIGLAVLMVLTGAVARAEDDGLTLKAALAHQSWREQRMVVSMTDLGGIANDDSVEAAQQNGAVFADALHQVPAYSEIIFDSGSQWYMLPNRSLEDVAPYVSVRIDGQIVAHDSIDAWPLQGTAGDYLPLFKVSNSVGFRIVGSGSVLGQGRAWWWAFALGHLGVSKRPILIEIDDCEDVRISGITLLDAPRFNIYLGEFTRRAKISRVTILVDWRTQLELLENSKSLPMFPFNTDGIDVAGKNVVIEHCIVSNWDDVIAVKPAERGRWTKNVLERLLFPDAEYERNEDDNDEADRRMQIAEAESLKDEWLWSWCTRDILVTNLTTVWGAGISVGSVHPSRHQPCVQDVVFDAVTMWRPLKGVYVKPDVAESECDRLGFPPCAARIANISYVDIHMQKDQVPEGWRLFELEARKRGLNHHWDSDDSRQLRAASDDANDDDEDFSCGTYDLLCFLWPVYIGVQQQLEPNGEGSGIWPDPDPRTSVTDIALTRITAKGGSWPKAAGVIRCNASNPCSGLRFTDVSIKADDFGIARTWVCDNGPTAYGTIQGNVSPDPSSCILPAPEVGHQ